MAALRGTAIISGTPGVDWYQSIFELIDMRSFSNLWFWIALAVLWSSSSHWVLGVPWDMAVRARKRPTEQSIRDFEDVVRINTNRIIYIAAESGLLLAGFVCFALTVLFMLGFVYRNEFSQAVFLLCFPVAIVAALSVMSAKTIQERELTGENLIKFMYKHRLLIQVIGMVSIFVTAMWGMLQNMTAGVLGG